MRVWVGLALVVVEAVVSVIAVVRMSGFRSREILIPLLLVSHFGAENFGSQSD